MALPENEFRSNFHTKPNRAGSRLYNAVRAVTLYRLCICINLYEIIGLNLYCIYSVIGCVYCYRRAIIIL